MLLCGSFQYIFICTGGGQQRKTRLRCTRPRGLFTVADGCSAPHCLCVDVQWYAVTGHAVCILLSSLSPLSSKKKKAVYQCVAVQRDGIKNEKTTAGERPQGQPVGGDDTMNRQVDARHKRRKTSGTPDWPTKSTQGGAYESRGRYPTRWVTRWAGTAWVCAQRLGRPWSGRVGWAPSVQNTVAMIRMSGRGSGQHLGGGVAAAGSSGRVGTPGADPYRGALHLGRPQNFQLHDVEKWTRGTHTGPGMFLRTVPWFAPESLIKRFSNIARCTLTDYSKAVP